MQLFGIKRYINYFKYVFRHKWFVLYAGIKLNASLWRLITHDMSKFKPSEFIPYANTFYTSDGASQWNVHKNYRRSWNAHMKNNPHHWQYWVYPNDDGSEVILDMPEKYMLEMVADWMGAGRAIHGKWEVVHWYNTNYNKIRLSDKTRKAVDEIIFNFKME